MKSKIEIMEKNESFTLALHSKCLPGTDKDVIIMVMHRKRKTEPKRENILLRRINLQIII